jgi:uncharacterized damage-inducible protein DinB
MYRTIDDFLKDWDHEFKATERVFGALTDKSLAQPVAAGHRTLGRIAWHIATTIPEMMNRTGLKVAGPAMDAPMPSGITAIRAGFSQAGESLALQIKTNWNDASLLVEDDMYGEKWARGITLAGLLMHQAHHRGEMFVLMRQAGLQPPGIYGPTMEEWAQYGMPAPAV